MNSPRNNTIARVIDTPIAVEESCTSSGEETRAEIVSARKPIRNDCPSTMTPRKNGFPSTGCLATTESIRCDSMCRSPSGLRTATAHTSRPRIITPSIRAWPP